MLSFLSRSAVSSETSDWLAECFSWAMQNFDREYFRHQTALVLPTDEFFPSQVDSPDAMARYVFQRVVTLAGVSAWPWHLLEAQGFIAEQPPLLGLNANVRGGEAAPMVSQADLVGQDLLVAQSEHKQSRLLMSYIPDQVSKPQDLIASMANGIAQHVLWQSQLTPPGGQSYFMQAAEVLAIFMGFGIMSTNSAYAFRGSCAKCYNPRANRQSSLSESECVYALALFCELKGLSPKHVMKHLKPYLKSAFKSSFRQIGRHSGTPHLNHLLS